MMYVRSIIKCIYVTDCLSLMVPCVSSLCVNDFKYYIYLMFYTAAMFSSYSCLHSITSMESSYSKPNESMYIVDLI